MFLDKLAQREHRWPPGRVLLLLLAGTATMTAQTPAEQCPGQGDGEVLGRVAGIHKDGRADMILNLGRLTIENGTGATEVNHLAPGVGDTRETEQEQGRKLQDLLRLDLGETVDLPFSIDFRGGDAAQPDALGEIEGSARGIVDEGTTAGTLALMLAASAADLASTEYALASGYAVEGNPFMQSRPFRIATSLAVPFVAHLLTRNNPRLRNWVCVVHVGMHSAFTVRNIYTGVTVRWR